MEASEFLQSTLYPAADHFIVEDLLDFSNDDVVITDAPNFNSSHSTVTAIESCNSSSFSCPEQNSAGDIGCRSFTDGQFAGDLCVPYDDLAELEWFSNFAVDSFSSEDLQKLQLISGMKTRPNVSSDTCGFQPQLANPPVPAKARSKRSRSAPCNWASHSRLLLLSSTTSSSQKTSTKKKDVGEASSEGRRCLHCATDKTPQWRTGPIGPKTLCNACGVRYISGRLVPEYRPASSPTFMLTKHSNSHRKVLELRPQKEMVRSQEQEQQEFMQIQNMVFDVSRARVDDYLIHQPLARGFRQLI